jgi:hypothetical protein
MPDIGNRGIYSRKDLAGKEEDVDAGQSQAAQEAERCENS